MKRNRFPMLLICFFIQFNPVIGQIDIGYKIDQIGELDRQFNISTQIYFDDRLVIDTILDVNQYVKTKRIKRGFLFFKHFPDGCKCWNIKFSMRATGFKHNLNVPIDKRKREKRIEFETKIRKSAYGFDEIRLNIAKKIYDLPKVIDYYRVWNPEIGNAPKYFIGNNSHYVLHGQSLDNSFEGILYRKVENDWERIYTGGYRNKRHPDRPLYEKDYAISFIRNDMDRSGLFEIDSIGEYKYQVYLGFDHYRQYEMDYGRLPDASVNHKEHYEKPKNIIQEFFEIEDYFKIE